MATRACASVVQMPLAGSKPTQPRSGTKASAQAWPACWLTMPSARRKCPATKRAGMAAERAQAMKMRVVLTDPALERERLHCRGAAVGGILVECHVLGDL